jgi:phenylacetate-coenzyme A ligase PaaK-like adenylate-forming protein
MDSTTFKSYIFGEVQPPGRQLTAKAAREMFDPEILRGKAAAFCEVPIDDILRVLEDVGECFRDKKGRYFTEAMERLPASLGLPEKMVQWGLEALPEMLSCRTSILRLSCLDDYHCLDRFTYRKGGGWNRAMPVGAVCHIAAGNIFLGSVDSLVYSLITKNVSLLKISSQDAIFPELFFRALNEVDGFGTVAPFAAMTYWDHQNTEIEEVIKSNFDAILLFGSEEAVVHYKNGLPARTELHAFGPKISFGLVCKDISEDELREAAGGFAGDIVFWEQRACTSCQNIFVEDEGQVDRFCLYLNEALEKMAEDFPQPEPDLDVAVEIRKERELGKWQAFRGAGSVREGKAAHHTVLARKGCDLQDSPLNRTVYVNSVGGYREILTGNIKHMKYYLSTLAVAAGRQTLQVVEDFIKCGIMRFCKPGSMSGRDTPASAHDGVYLPRRLVRQVENEDLPDCFFGLESVDQKKEDTLLLSRLNSVIRTAMEAPFYREFYKDVRLPLKSLKDFELLPVLEKKHIIEHGPAGDSTMLTREAKGCYIFSAGGTTGKMKYVCWSREELEESKKLFGYGFRAAGINSNDVAANYLRAGALWTAFMVTNAGLEETGCRIISLSANQSEAETIQYILAFNPNVIMSISGNLVLLAQAAERAGIALNIDKVFYSGEHMPASVMDYVRRGLGAKSVRSFGYAAVEVGPIGFQCPHCSGTEHHPLEDWCYVEATDDGEALLTTLKRTLHPVVRYRVGDLIQWVDEPCACGRTAPRFKLLSRSDDVILFNYDGLHLSQIDEAIGRFPQLSSFFQVTVEPDAEMIALTIRIEAKAEVVDRDLTAKAAEFLQTIQGLSPALGMHRDINLIKDIKVEFIPSNAIERVSRTGKIRRVVDKRV